MVFEYLPWLGLAAQAGGAVIMAFSGGFGLGTRKYDPKGTALGLALFLAGCVSFVVFALSVSNVALAAIQGIAAVLVGLGVARKARERHKGP